MHEISMLLYAAFYLSLGYIGFIGLVWLVTRNEPELWMFRDWATMPFRLAVGLFGMKIDLQESRPEVQEQLERERAEERVATGGGSNPFKSVHHAKEYLISRIVAEAEREGGSLSEIERKMLDFSETSWTLPELDEANAEFERECNETEYEEKIAGLVRNLLERATPEEQQTWDDAFVQLFEGDHYLQVLIEGAVPKAAPTLGKVARWLPSLDRVAKRPPGDLLRLLLFALLITVAILVFGIISGDWR